MSVIPPDDIDFIDLSDNAQEPRRRPRRGNRPPVEQPNNFGGSDPRFLFPVVLFLLGLLVIGLAWRARGGGEQDQAANSTPVDSELVQSVADAQARAGFGGLTIEEIDGVLVIDGAAANTTDVAAIGAVARSVEGTQRVDNRVIVEGGTLESGRTVADPAASGGLAGQLNSLGRISFEPGSSDLTNEGSIVVDNVARTLEQSPGSAIEVHGHTDSEGDEARNQVLSQERAQAVVSALAQRGIDTDRLTAVGFGESNPIAPNVTAEGRATNRRIEFVTPPAE